MEEGQKDSKAKEIARGNESYEMVEESDETSQRNGKDQRSNNIFWLTFLFSGEFSNNWRITGECEDNELMKLNRTRVNEARGDTQQWL